MPESALRCRAAIRRRLLLRLDDGDILSALYEDDAARSDPAPIILVHGLAGSEHSAAVRLVARHLVGTGFAVIRLNLRGAGESRVLCTQQYHAGRTEDLRAAVLELRRQGVAKDFFLFGVSLGGNLVLKLLGEQDEALPLCGAVVVSAPIDLVVSARCMEAPRNRLYQHHLLRMMKREAIAAPKLSALERAIIEGARSIRQFDDRVVARRNGFADADEYYTASSALRFLPGVRTPTLLVQSLDDPWIPSRTYREFPWSKNPSLNLLLVKRGGHLGFHGRGARAPWHARVAEAFLRNLLLNRATCRPTSGRVRSALQEQQAFS